MPVARTPIQRYFDRLKRKKTRGWVVEDGVLYMRFKHLSSPDKIFRIPIEFFTHKVQQVRVEFNIDPDMWDDTHKERLKEVCGRDWSHISDTDRHKTAIMVRKRGLLKRMKGGYRRNVVGGMSSNGDDQNAVS